MTQMLSPAARIASSLFLLLCLLLLSSCGGTKKEEIPLPVYKNRWVLPDRPVSMDQCVSLKDIPRAPTKEQTDPNNPDWVAIATYMRIMEEKLVVCSYVRDKLPEWWAQQQQEIDRLNTAEEKNK